MSEYTRDEMLADIERAFESRSQGWAEDTETIQTTGNSNRYARRRRKLNFDADMNRIHLKWHRPERSGGMTLTAKQEQERTAMERMAHLMNRDMELSREMMGLSVSVALWGVEERNRFNEILMERLDGQTEMHKWMLLLAQGFADGSIKIQGV